MMHCVQLTLCFTVQKWQPATFGGGGSLGMFVCRNLMIKGTGLPKPGLPDSWYLMAVGKCRCQLRVDQLTNDGSHLVSTSHHN